MKRLPEPRTIARAIGRARIHHYSLFCIYIASLLLALGLFLWLKPVKSRGMEHTTAVVKSVNARVTSNTSAIMQYNVFEFKTPDGSTVQFNGEPAVTPRHKVGDIVPVAYNKANPRFARDLSTRPPGFASILSFTLSLLALIIALSLGWHHHLAVKHAAQKTKD